MFNFPSFFDNSSYRTPRQSNYGFDDPFWNPLRSQHPRTPRSQGQRKGVYRPRTQQQEPLVYHEATCDGCREYPIVGTRYHCSVCNDFDFCEHCWKTRRHPHPFYKIETPEEEPSHPSMKRTPRKEEQRAPQRESFLRRNKIFEEEEQAVPQKPKETYQAKKNVFDNKENMRPETIKQEARKPQTQTAQNIKPKTQPQTQIPTQKQLQNMFMNKSNMVIIRDETNEFNPRVVDVIYC